MLERVEVGVDDLKPADRAEDRHGRRLQLQVRAAQPRNDHPAAPQREFQAATERNQRQATAPDIGFGLRLGIAVKLKSGGRLEHHGIELEPEGRAPGRLRQNLSATR